MSPHPFPNISVVLPDPSLPDVTKVGGVFSREDLEAIERVRAALDSLAGYQFDYWDDHGQLLRRLAAETPSFVVNLCDTGFRNFAPHELHVPALLEIFGVPYTGSPPTCLGLCFDKAIVRALAADCGIPVPAQRFLAPDDDPAAMDLPVPALVKPNRADGGLGITAASVVATRPELEARIAELRAELPGHDLLVQDYLTGEEYGVGIVGNPGHGFLALPVLQVDWSGLPGDLPRILGYESKTLPDSPYWTGLRYQRATLAEDAQARMVAHAEILFERLGCRDYARFDFRAGADGVPRLLEANPNPAWCWDGKLNIMAGFAGTSYAELLGLILDTAQRRARGS